ncbi:hypothetical protein ACJMK2_034901, partial [Sinanodonta woodiana]
MKEVRITDMPSGVLTCEHVPFRLKGKGSHCTCPCYLQLCQAFLIELIATRHDDYLEMKIAKRF